MRISDWSSDVCSSDLFKGAVRCRARGGLCLFRLWPSKAVGHSGRAGERAAAGRRRGCAAEYGAREDDPVAVGARARKSVVWGKSVSVRVDLGGRRIIKNKKSTSTNLHNIQ